MRRVLLCVLLAGAAVYGNACSTIAGSTSANWSSASTWLNCGGTYPGPGDTFTISRPVTVDVDVVVGTSPADTSASITGAGGEIIRNGSGANGFLTVAPGVSFTMRGSVRLTSADGARAGVLLQAGSTWMFDNSLAGDPASTIYRVYPSADGAQSDLLIRGSAASRATVRGRPAECVTCANGILYQSNTGGNSGRGAGISMDAQYADFYDLGSAARGGVEFALAYPGQYLRMSHCKLARTGGLQQALASAAASPSDGSQDLVLDDVKTTDGLQTALRITSAQHLTMSSGRFRIVNSYFDTGFAGGLSGASLDHDVFDGTFEPIDDPAYTPASVSRVVIHQARVRGTFATWHGSATDVYTYMDSFSTPSSPKFWKLDPGSTQTGWVIEYGTNTDSNAICFEANGALASSAITLRNAIVLPNAQGKSTTASCRAIHTGTTGDSWNVFHSTIAFGPTSAIYYDSGAAGKVLNLKSNIFLDGMPSVRTSPISAASASATLNHVAALGISNNAVYHGRLATRWTNSYGSCAGANCTSNGTPYDVPMNGVAPGSGDLYADPVVYWAYRKTIEAGLREWANARYSVKYDAGSNFTGSYTANNQFAALGADPNLAAAIDDLFSYIRLWWAPVNSALKAAGHDGQDIGASPMAELRYRAYAANGLPDGNSFDNSDAWAIYFDQSPKLAGKARGFDGVFLRLAPGAPAVVPGVSTNCYVFHDGDAANTTLVANAAAIDGCIFDVGGSATNVTMSDAPSGGGFAARHVIVLPAMNGQYAGPIARNAAGSFAHNTCWHRCLDPGDPAVQTSSISWPPATADGAPDPLWYDYRRNLALFDSKYLGHTAPRWSADPTYTQGAFVSYSKAGVYWGETVNFRYRGDPACGGANPEPLVAPNWRSCWEYASLYRIRMGLPDPTADPPRTSLDVYDDQKIGAHGDDPITVLVKWVRAGYMPTNPAFVGAGADGYDAGAMPAIYSQQVTRSPKSLSPEQSVTAGGRIAISGTAKVQR